MPFNYNDFRELVRSVGLSYRDLADDINQFSNAKDLELTITQQTISNLHRGLKGVTVQRIDLFYRYAESKGLDSLEFYLPPPKYVPSK
jgi:hypothetical protein